MSEWKPVTEEPEKSGWYPVICLDRGGWQQAFYDKAEKRWTECKAGSPVTHWTTLPALPNGQ